LLKSEIKKVALILNSDVEVADFIFNSFFLDVADHPVGLPLVNVLVPNQRFAYYTFMRVVTTIESLVILVNYQFWMTETVLHFFKGLVSALMAWYTPIARNEVNI